MTALPKSLRSRAPSPLRGEGRGEGPFPPHHSSPPPAPTTVSSPRRRGPPLPFLHSTTEVLAFAGMTSRVQKNPTYPRPQCSMPSSARSRRQHAAPTKRRAGRRAARGRLGGGVDVDHRPVPVLPFGVMPRRRTQHHPQGGRSRHAPKKPVVGSGFRLFYFYQFGAKAAFHRARRASRPCPRDAPLGPGGALACLR
jgi:hypothetical protein